MAELRVALMVDGYWLYEDRDCLPARSGVYFVYRGVDFPGTSFVELRELIYIGEAGNLNERVEAHNKDTARKGRRKDRRDGGWWSVVHRGETLFFCCAQVRSHRRKRVEAALINFHEPRLNIDFVNHFPFDDTRVRLQGRYAGLDRMFWAYRDP